MLLSSDFVLNRVASRECITLYPFLHSSCNVFDTEEALRSARKEAEAKARSA